MKYRRKHATVDAVQLKQFLITGADAGDWLVTEGENQFFMSDEEFKNTFEEDKFIVNIDKMYVDKNNFGKTILLNGGVNPPYSIDCNSNDSPPEKPRATPSWNP